MCSSDVRARADATAFFAIAAHASLLSAVARKTQVAGG